MLAGASSAADGMPPRMRVSSRARKRHSTNRITTETTVTTASTTRAITGCDHESQSIAGTAPSPTSDRARLENGSGEVLAEARVVSLAAWLVAASVPPISAAAVTQLAGSPPKTAPARAAPAGILTKVWTASQTLSRPGILSTKNSRKSIRPAAPMTTGCASTWRSPGSVTQPSQPARPVRNTTAYRRRPLAQPRTAAMATSWVRSRFIAPIAASSSRGSSSRLPGLPRSRGCRRCGAPSRCATRR